MRKPTFCICEKKDADQLHGNHEADQRLCFRYMASTIPLLPKSEISSLYPSSVAVQPGLHRTWSETPKTGFLTTRLKWFNKNEKNWPQPMLHPLSWQMNTDQLALLDFWPLVKGLCLVLATRDKPLCLMHFLIDLLHFWPLPDVWLRRTGFVCIGH